MLNRTILLDFVQGILIGAGLSFVAVLFILPNLYITKANGWTTMFGCGEPGNGILLRAACAVKSAGPINVPQEAMYWTTNSDGTGQKLSGGHDYTLHFSAGQLPPNKAFWSLTMSDAKNHFVANPINRYSVSDRSGLRAERGWFHRHLHPERSPGWKGRVPVGMKQIFSPNDSVRLIGRVLVCSDSDLTTAFALTK